MSEPSPLVLASRSPRRARILETLGIPFEARPTFADERSVTDADLVELARKTARLKLDHALEAASESDAFVLAADTIVCVDGEVLGQPDDDHEGQRMLRRLGGRCHVVRTGVALGRIGRGPLDDLVAETRVWFRQLSDEEILRYVATGEGRDKAGGYAVQGLAGGFVERLDGSYTNVVGLPAADVVTLLVAHGALTRWP